MFFTKTNLNSHLVERDEIIYNHNIVTVNFGAEILFVLFKGK